MGCRRDDLDLDESSCMPLSLWRLWEQLGLCGWRKRQLGIADETRTLWTPQRVVPFDRKSEVSYACFKYRSLACSGVCHFYSGSDDIRVASVTARGPTRNRMR